MGYKNITNEACLTCKGLCCGRCSDGYFYEDRGDKIPDEIKPILKSFRHRSEFYDKPEIVESNLAILRKHWGESVQWSAENGFLTSTGCSIPRKHRSNTCKDYLCNYLEKGKSIEDWHFNKDIERWHAERKERGLDK